MIQKNCVGRVSFTTDMWSDPDLKPYMAITGHWMELDSSNKLTLRAALLGFLCVPGSYSGESLA